MFSFFLFSLPFLLKGCSCFSLFFVGRYLTVFNSQCLVQVGGRWNEKKQSLDWPFQVKQRSNRGLWPHHCWLTKLCLIQFYYSTLCHVRSLSRIILNGRQRKVVLSIFMCICMILLRSVWSCRGYQYCNLEQLPNVQWS